MSERQFLEDVANDSETRTRLVAHVEAELDSFARTEGITANELSNTEIEQLARGIIKRGLAE